MINVSMKTERMNQSGFASMVVGLILVLVLALMTVGFSTLVRHEQTATLNKQLSAQAYYAAESGINDATRDIQKYAGAGSITTCNNADVSHYPDVKDGVTLNGSNGVGYTCVLVSLSAPDLVYNILSASQWYATQITTSSAIDTLSFAWQNTGGPDCFQNTFNASDSGNFPTSGALSTNTTCDSGAGTAFGTDPLEISLTPLDSIGQPTRTALINNTYQTVLYPNRQNANLSTIVTPGSTSYTGNAGNTTNPSPSPSGNPIIAGNCGQQATVGATSDPAPSLPNKYYCRVNITNLPANNTHFLLAMKTVYNTQKTNVDITGFFGGAGGTRQNFAGTQAIIDATGKAQNVLRRIQVRVPIGAATNSNLLPDALSGDDGICKRMQTNNSGTQFMDFNEAPLASGSTDTCNGAHS